VLGVVANGGSAMSGYAAYARATAATTAASNGSNGHAGAPMAVRGSDDPPRTL
jgi:hypothetical protein